MLSQAIVGRHCLLTDATFGDVHLSRRLEDWRSVTECMPSCDVVAWTESELAKRPRRAPDYVRENAAFVRLAEQLAEQPEQLLSVLCDVLLELCDADSVGVSLFATNQAGADFVWPAISGQWAPYKGGGMPRDASPCGVVVARDAVLLFQDVEKSFPASAAASPPIQELLLAPFHQAGTPVGTVWLVRHDKVGVFDEEHRRVLTNLARFAAAAYKVAQFDTVARDAQRRRDALDQLEMRFRDVGDPGQLSFAASELLAETFNACRVGYGAIDRIARTITVERDWTAPGLRTLAGVNNFDDYGSIFQDLEKGIPVVVSDIATDPRTAAAIASFEAIGNFAFVDVVVLENGAAAAQMYVHSAAPRRWLPEEISLIQEVAERTRSAIARREAERALILHAASLEDRVAARTRDLEDVHERLRQSQKMEVIGQLTGGIAHDFNNLLTVIRGSVDLLRRPDLTEARRMQYTDAIGDTADRAVKLTGQLLAFARRQTLRPEVFDVRETLNGVVDMLNSVTGNLVRIDLRIGEDPCVVQADTNQFETALVNMAVNAKDAMDGGGILTIAVERGQPMPEIRGHGSGPGPFVKISITDTGSGISSENAERIFEPFFTTKEVGRGTGLGLSQVFGFAKQSGGNVTVDSELGVGTTFSLYLAEMEAGTPLRPPPSEPEATTRADGQDILVVEDNVEVGQFCMQVLEDLGYRTVWVASAEEALRVIDAPDAHFDAVFSDVVMPGMGGVELARILKRMRPALPIILATGYSDVIVQDGAQGFQLLPKPYSAEQLSRALDHAIKSGALHGTA